MALLWSDVESPLDSGHVTALAGKFVLTLAAAGQAETNSTTPLSATGKCNGNPQGRACFGFRWVCELKVMTPSSAPVPFHPGTEMVADRARAEAAVEECLAGIRNGVLPGEAERQRVDIKEEAGRRGAGGRLLAGNRENTKAADQLADEVAAMANTPGGGALIVGIEDKTGDLLGTELDEEWLRHRSPGESTSLPTLPRGSKPASDFW